MTKMLRITLLIGILFLSMPIIAQSTRNIEGNWIATLEFSGAKVRLVLKVLKSADGFTAKMDSPDQGAKDLAIDSIRQEGSSVRFEAKTYGMSYEGTLDDAGTEMKGNFKQGPASIPLVFKRFTETVEKARTPRSQEPRKPYPYDEEEVAYVNKRDGVKLAGTLTLPRSQGPHPAVILITGSGSQDRDESVAGHRPFLVLADHLTRNGIAVLRVDDRGTGGSTLGSLKATSDNFAGDVLAGIEYLKDRKEINAKEIGLIGHSEGGMIAPMAATRSNDVAFIVLLAGPGQTGEEVIISQNQQGLKGLDPLLAAQAMKAVRSILNVAKSNANDADARKQIIDALEKQLASMSDSEKEAFAPIEKAIRQQIEMMLNPWYRYFLAYDPRPTLEKVGVPVLALNGENDTQVPAKLNLDLIEAALKAGKNKDFTIMSFPKLNHLFQTSTTGETSEYEKIDETFAPVVLFTISDWILKHTTISKPAPVTPK